MMPLTRGPFFACLLTAWASAAPAQEPLQLGTLYQQALDADPRARAFALQTAQTDLRVRNLEAERRPFLSALGSAQYQSDVPTAPFTLPGGQPVFSTPHDLYDASLRVDQRLVDPALALRIGLARAELAETQARLRATLFGLRQQVDEAFFTAALLQERAGALAAAIADLETRLRETEARVREGAALAGEAAAVEATLLERRQQHDELRSNRLAALARLSELTGRAIGEDAELAIPDLGAAVADARRSLDGLRARPEYEQFRRARDRVALQQDLAAAQERPQLSAFGRVGYGKPGLNFISDQWESYALGGLQLQWKAWTWGTAGRERAALALQRDIVAADEAAFAGGLRRIVQTDLATIDRLQTALAMDDRIVALREAVERGARARFQEGVVAASEFLDRTSERLGAAFARAGRRVELAQASARVLTTLGLEVR